MLLKKQNNGMLAWLGLGYILCGYGSKSKYYKMLDELGCAELVIMVPFSTI